MAFLIQWLCTLAAMWVGQEVYAKHYAFSGSTTEAALSSQLIHQNAGPASIETEFLLAGVDLEAQGDGFHKLNVKGLSLLNNTGAPELYTTGELFIIPDGYEAQLTVTKQEQTKIENTVVRPVQRKKRCGHSNEFSFQSDLYQTNGTYPSQVIRLQEVGMMQNLRLARLAIQPMQMHFSTRTLFVTHQLKARIDFVPSTTKQRLQNISQSILRLARHTTVNGKDLGQNVRVTKEDESLLILVGDGLFNAVQPYVQWKRQTGMKVTVVSNTEAFKTPEKIKATIQNIYDAAEVKPTYLLLVGNRKTMPAFTENLAAINGHKYLSDYPFTLLSGTDGIPDIFAGRLLADTEEEAKAQIERWIAFEKTPEQKDWYSVGTTIASDETGPAGISDEEYAQQMEAALKAHTYQSLDRFYQSNGNATPENILDSLNEGRSYLTYLGHGSGESWGNTNGEFDIETLKTTENERLPVIIDVACNNSNYLQFKNPFGKVWVTHQHSGKNAKKNVGAVGFYGGTESVWWDESAIMGVGIAKYHFEKAIHSLGGSVIAGQLYLIEQTGAEASQTIDNLKLYHLFGDPSLTMRTTMPLAYSVKSTTTEDTENRSVLVQVMDLSGRGVQGLSVALSKENGTLLANAVTDAKGETNLSMVKTSSAPPVILTVTGYNAETYQTTIY